MSNESRSEGGGLDARMAEFFARAEAEFLEEFAGVLDRWCGLGLQRDLDELLRLRDAPPPVSTRRQVYQLLIELLPHLESDSVRMFVIQALGHRQAGRAAGRALSRELHSARHAGATESVLSEVGESLRRTGYQLPKAELLGVLEDPAYGSARQALAGRLVKHIDDPRAAAVFRSALEHGPPGFRAAVLREIRVKRLTEFREYVEPLLDPGYQIPGQVREVLEALDRA